MITAPWHVQPQAGGEAFCCPVRHWRAAIRLKVINGPALVRCGLVGYICLAIGADHVIHHKIDAPHGPVPMGRRGRDASRRTSCTRSSARTWSSVSSVGDRPPCKQKICATASCDQHFFGGSVSRHGCSRAGMQSEEGTLAGMALVSGADSSRLAAPVRAATGMGG